METIWDITANPTQLSKHFSSQGLVLLEKKNVFSNKYVFQQFLSGMKFRVWKLKQL